MLLADIQEAKVAQVAAEIGEQGRNAVAMAVDVTQNDQVEAMIQKAIETFGKVDILVNDAGGSGNQGILRIDDVTEDAWDASVDLNLKGVFLCCRAVVAHMRERGYGRIVNISSSSAKGSFGDLGTSAIRLPYAAAKSGVLGFTYQLAKDVARDGIYVNAVMPGFILTELDARVNSRYQALPQEAKDAMVTNIPLGRPGQASEVAKAVAFLASNDASYITGTTLEVMGGR
jgi:NAD(P)-dependent dehydrogenase (short-subunit alcohol dehydrogenase family)